MRRASLRSDATSWSPQKDGLIVRIRAIRRLLPGWSVGRFGTVRAIATRRRRCSGRCAGRAGRAVGVAHDSSRSLLERGAGALTIEVVLAVLAPAAGVGAWSASFGARVDQWCLAVGAGVPVSSEERRVG